MIEGLEILLERMKTHPEEFLDATNDYAGSSKWGKLIHKYNNVLTKEEIKAFNDALHALHRQQFTSEVLESLLHEPMRIDPDTYTINTTGRHAWQSPTLIGSNTTAKSLLQMQEEQLAQIKEIMKTEIQQATKKRSK